MENAIVSLAMAARIAGIPADPESLCRAFPSRDPSASPLVLLQTFGPITPLFSQVIIDEVLIHKGLSTLDVLVLGLFLINSSVHSSVHQLCKNSDQELFFSLGFTI